MPELLVLVGPPCSGKTTYANAYVSSLGCAPPTPFSVSTAPSPAAAPPAGVSGDASGSPSLGGGVARESEWVVVSEKELASLGGGLHRRNKAVWRAMFPEAPFGFNAAAAAAASSVTSSGNSSALPTQEWLSDPSRSRSVVLDGTNASAAERASLFAYLRGELRRFPSAPQPAAAPTPILSMPFAPSSSPPPSPSPARGAAPSPTPLPFGSSQPPQPLSSKAPPSAQSPATAEDKPRFAGLIGITVAVFEDAPAPLAKGGQRPLPAQQLRAAVASHHVTPPSTAALSAAAAGEGKGVPLRRAWGGWRDGEGRGPPPPHGSGRRQLFGYRLADACLRMGAAAVAAVTVAPGGAEAPAAVLPSDRPTAPSLGTASLFATPSGPSAALVERPTAAEGADRIITVFLLDALADAVGCDAAAAASRALALAAAHGVLGNPHTIAAPPPFLALHNGFFASSHRGKVSALFLPARCLVAFLPSRRREGALRPVLSPSVLRALFLWACGGSDNRRAVIITGTVGGKTLTNSSSAHKGRGGDGPTPQADVEAEAPPVTFRLVQQLLEGLRLPIPLFSFSTHLSGTRHQSRRGASSAAPSQPNHHGSGASPISLTSGAGSASVPATPSAQPPPEDFLPLDACSVAYLERLLCLDVLSCVGVGGPLLVGGGNGGIPSAEAAMGHLLAVAPSSSAASESSSSSSLLMLEAAPTRFGFGCVSLGDFLRAPTAPLRISSSTNSSSATTCGDVNSLPQQQRFSWTDWTAHPCFGAADRTMRSGAASCVEHPFGTMVSGRLQCHSGDLPRLFAVDFGVAPQSIMQQGDSGVGTNAANAGGGDGGSGGDASSASAVAPTRSVRRSLGPAAAADTLAHRSTWGALGPVSGHTIPDDGAPTAAHAGGALRREGTRAFVGGGSGSGGPLPATFTGVLDSDVLATDPSSSAGAPQQSHGAAARPLVVGGSSQQRGDLPFPHAPFLLCAPPATTAVAASSSSLSSVFSASAVEHGLAYTAAGQVRLATVKVSLGAPTPHRSIVLGLEGACVSGGGGAAAAGWGRWGGPDEPTAYGTALVEASVWSSDRSAHHSCTLFIDLLSAGGGRTVACYCSCGTATAPYGGSHCRHGAAVAVLLSQRPREALLANAAAALQEEREAEAAREREKEKAVAEGLPADAAGDGHQQQQQEGSGGMATEGGAVGASSTLVLSGAAARSTYVVPSFPAGGANGLAPLVAGGIPQSLLPKSSHRSGARRVAAAAADGEGEGEGGQPSTGGRRRVGGLSMGAGGIPAKRIPLGPSAPTRRPLTPYFWFMRRALAAAGGGGGGGGGTAERQPAALASRPMRSGAAALPSVALAPSTVDAFNAVRSSVFAYPPRPNGGDDDETGSEADVEGDERYERIATDSDDDDAADADGFYAHGGGHIAAPASAALSHNPFEVFGESPRRARRPQPADDGSALPQPQLDDPQPPPPPQTRPAMRVTETTRLLAAQWRALPAEERARCEAECQAYNVEVRAEWAAYTATEEFSAAMAAYVARIAAAADASEAAAAAGTRAGVAEAGPLRSRGGGGGGIGQKRGREAAVGADDVTDDEGGVAVTANANPNPNPNGNGASSQWRRNRHGEWVCEWDSSGTETDGDDANADDARREQNATPARPQPTAHVPRAPVLGSLFGEAAGDSSGAFGLGLATMGTMAQMTRNSTVAGMALAQSTVGGSGPAGPPRGTCPYAATASRHPSERHESPTARE